MVNQRPLRAVITTGSVDPLQSSLPLVLVNADGSAASTVKTQVAQVDSTATTIAGLVADFNALLAKLRAAGVIAP